MLRVLAGIYTPNCGEIRVEGRVSTLFITSPGLDPEDTGFENIQTCGRFLGMTKKEIIAKLPEFEKGDRFQLNIVGCAMLGAFVLSMPHRPDVESLADYYEKAQMTSLTKWFCRRSGKSKFTPKDISRMKATAAR